MDLHPGAREWDSEGGRDLLVGKAILSPHQQGRAVDLGDLLKGAKHGVEGLLVLGLDVGPGRWVEEKFGQKCAKVTVKISMKATGKDDAGQKTKTKITLEGPVWFGLTAGRSLGMELEGKLVVNGSLPNGQPMKIDIDLKAKGESKPGVADFEAKAEEGDEEEGEGDEGEEEEGGMK